MENKTESELISMKLDPKELNFTIKMAKKKANKLVSMKMGKWNTKLSFQTMSCTEYTYLTIMMSLLLINNIMKKEILFEKWFQVFKFK